LNDVVKSAKDSVENLVNNGCSSGLEIFDTWELHQRNYGV
jgi:hypothetical protein